MSNYLTPTLGTLREVYTMLFGDETRVAESKDVAKINTSKYAAVYIDDENKTAAACVFNIDFIAYSGSALTMIPIDAAEEVIAGDEPGQTMLENARELSNIFSSLFMDDSSAHLRLGVVVPVAQLEAEQIQEIARLETGVGFNIHIPGYGDCNLSFWH